MSKYNSDLGKERILGIIESGVGSVHFSGVGGVGMSSLAMLTASFGIGVSGSDRERGEYTDALISSGISLSIGKEAKVPEDTALLVYTLALDEYDPELLYAARLGIPTVSRAEYLGALMEKYKTRIGVSGSHGKSTSTAMLEYVFRKAGRHPTVISGAPLSGLSSPYLIGDRDELIYEACEYKDSFHSFSPTHALFTNVELDHVDYFENQGAIEKSFLRAMNMPRLSVLNLDDEATRRLIPDVGVPFVTYGESEGADARISKVTSRAGYCSFEFLWRGNSERIELSVPGRFNVSNAAGVYVMAVSLGISPDVAKEALSEFRGISRRLEYLGQLSGNSVYYDYAHHPTEMKKTLDTLREMTEKTICVLYRPHTYTRTSYFFKEEAQALSEADRVFVMDIAGVREREIPGVDSEKLAALIGSHAERIEAGDAVKRLSELRDSFIVLMGAADIGIGKIREHVIP